MTSKQSLDDRDVLEMASTFTPEMLGNVDGPDCTDRATCANNCCGIMIDVPGALARHYIRKGYLEARDIRRGDAFAWKLNVNPGTGRCVFYDPAIHGCRIYIEDLASRPPQCAIYPAGYTNGTEKCKAGAGPWIIRDKEKGMACEHLMSVYTANCVREREAVKSHFINDTRAFLHPEFQAMIRESKPSTIAGIQDGWTGLEPMTTNGLSFSVKSLCEALDCKEDFLGCERACDRLAGELVEFLLETLPGFVETNDLKEVYSILELKNSRKTR